MNWKEILSPMENSVYFSELMQKVNLEYENETVFPSKELIFRAMQVASFEEVKVVILGQDPYHNDMQAEGLSFSVPNGVKAPPSLRNIFKELNDDVAVARTHTSLEDWARQGVLLLNATLTVRAHQPNSHHFLGWEKYTDFIIQQLSIRRKNIVFVLWGAFAQKKKSLIDAENHKIITSPHPSPFSAHKGFFGSAPFSKINTYLSQNQIKEITW